MGRRTYHGYLTFSMNLSRALPHHPLAAPGIRSDPPTKSLVARSRLSLIDSPRYHHSILRPANLDFALETLKVASFRHHPLVLDVIHRSMTDLRKRQSDPILKPGIADCFSRR